MTAGSTKENGNNSSLRLRQILIRLLLVLLLSALAVAEGYYIFILRDRIDKQTEEIKNVSMELQKLKLERGNLSEELSSIKKSTIGEDKDGDTDKR
jgi:cell division protein FtsL